MELVKGSFKLQADKAEQPIKSRWHVIKAAVEAFIGRVLDGLAASWDRTTR